MQKIKIQCPAKVNLTLKVLNKRDDGFHNIESIMQTINLFDYLDISIENFNGLEISLSGNSPEIPYDGKNLVYKAAKLYLEENKITNKKISVYIEKNIPVSAGLAGGSTDAAGVLFGLNKLFNGIMSDTEINKLCAKLGSDLNFCLQGGCMLTRGRGEITEPAEYKKMPVNLIKPLDLGISAKEAYTKFSEKKSKNVSGRENFINDLEWAVVDDYKELLFIKSTYPDSVMTGSGSTYYSLKEEFQPHAGFWVKNGLETIPFGVKEAVLKF